MTTETGTHTPREELRTDWPVGGTTGYEFMADATGLFIDPAGEAPLTALHARLTGERRPFAELADEFLEYSVANRHHGFSNVRETLDEIHKGMSKAYPWVGPANDQKVKLRPS